MLRKEATRSFLGINYVSWVLALADAFIVGIAFVLSYLFCSLLPNFEPATEYMHLFPFIICFPFVLLCMGLYPGTLLHPAEEIKRISVATSLAFLLLVGLFFLFKSSDSFSRVFFLLSWVLSLFFLPLARYVLRKFCSTKAWWKIPVVVIGAQKDLLSLLPYQNSMLFSSYSCVKYFVLEEKEQNTPMSVPSEISEREEHSEKIDATPYESFSGDDFSSIEQQLAEMTKIAPDLLVLLQLSDEINVTQAKLIEKISVHCRRILLLPSKNWLPCVPDSIASFGIRFGLTLKRNLADPRRLALKRLIDLCCAFILLIPLLPLTALIALLIRLDSKGPVLFTQKRIGRGGKSFSIYKFRTMSVNAQALLEEYLLQNPAAAQEWKETQKLLHDPRVTKLGKFLRKTSLDELPQLFNILLGDMSFVGPRPIVEAEIAKYKDAYDLYIRCLPGITGLWQVSGRSDTSYAYRVELDVYYINNWSVWLDYYILLRTVPVVLLQKGAY